MGFATILGLDLGKFKSVCCVMDVSTHTQTFQTVQTTPQGLHDLLTLHTRRPRLTKCGGRSSAIQRMRLGPFVWVNEAPAGPPIECGIGWMTIE